VFIAEGLLPLFRALLLRLAFDYSRPKAPDTPIKRKYNEFFGEAASRRASPSPDARCEPPQRGKRTMMHQLWFRLASPDHCFAY
jgi:hypothetical protein